MGFINKYVTKGTVAAVLSVAAIVAGAAGFNPLKDFLSNPATADTILSVVAGAAALIAGVAAGVKKD